MEYRCPSWNGKPDADAHTVRRLGDRQHQSGSLLKWAMLFAALTPLNVVPWSPFQLALSLRDGTQESLSKL